jgi:hypothetical protein
VGAVEVKDSAPECDEDEPSGLRQSPKIRGGCGEPLRLSVGGDLLGLSCRSSPRGRYDSEDRWR